MSEPLAQHGEVFHAGGQKFRLVVDDACIVQLVEKFLDVLVGEVGHHDGLDKRRIRLNAALLAQLDGLEAFFDGGCKRLQQIAEFRRHNRYAGVELHLALELFEKVEDAFSVMFV